MVNITLHSSMSFENNQKVSYAVAISLIFHLLVVIIYPHLIQIRLPEVPERLEIEMLSIRSFLPTTEPLNEAPKVKSPVIPPNKLNTKPEPALKESPKPILSTQNADVDYQVSEQSQQVKQEVTPSSHSTNRMAATSNIETHQSSESQVITESRSSAVGNAPVRNETDELTANDSDAWGDYGDQLSSLVNKSKQYPMIAIRRHLEGEATIVAQFVHGELSQVTLFESSKHTSLDEEAIRMVKKAIAQLGVKDSLKKKSFKITIPVSFKLE